MKNYETVIDLLADKIKEQETDIYLLKYQVEELKRQLAEAERHLNPPPETAKEFEIR